ncbi:MAG: hypothetical protein L0Y35_02940, partial [Flammeovirgaceae bacterium]|nr:hypothetical protein [Flammeovirgaceae bacterium]
MGSADRIFQKIDGFRRRYYFNLLIRGLLLSLSIILIYFLIAAFTEHFLWLDSTGRLIIFSCFFLISGWCVYKFLRSPLQWWVAKKGLNEEQSAKIIGQSMPVVQDKLVNFIQLYSQGKATSLAAASLDQRSSEFEPVSFDSVVDLKENRRYLKYLSIPLGAIVIALVLNQNLLVGSADRIIHFNQHFSPQAPFNFFVINKSLDAFYQEDFTVQASLSGESLPDQLYIVFGSQRFKMDRTNDIHEFTFEKVQEGFSFQLEGAGFYSQKYQVQLISRPELTRFSVELEFPKYIQRKNERLENTGNLEIPEGTVVRWKLGTRDALKGTIKFHSDNQFNNLQIIDNQLFTYSKAFKNPDEYALAFENDKSKNKEKISYRIDVVKDAYPDIVVNNFKDSILYQRIVLAGLLTDDYGLSQLTLQYAIKDEKGNAIQTRSLPISISSNQLQQSFFFNWNLDSLQLKSGQTLEYYLQVWDNDGVNGRKSTKSSSYTLFMPTEEQLATEIKQSEKTTQEKINQGAAKAEELKKEIDETYQRIKGKQSLDWQDKKQLEDILQQKKELDKMLSQMKEQNDLLNDKKETFTEQDERIREKAEQIQKLMNELLDEETRKLFEELEKLLKENADPNQLQKLMDKMNQSSNNMEKELERLLELFKQLQFEDKLDQSIKGLEKQIESQKELLEKTESLERESKEGELSKTEKEESSQKLAEEQKQLNDELENSEEKLDELKQLGKELNQDQQLPEEEDFNSIDQQQQESQEMLEKNQPSKAKQPQKNAAQQMEQMKKGLEQMQGSMSMEIDQQNLEALRQIIHGLVKLSYDQEGLIKTFNELEQSDPRYNVLAQQQIKLQDDAKVLEDSLLALAKRDFMMGSFVTREITELNDHIKKSIGAYQDRRRPQAASEMQFSMTSINNLALMLDQHFSNLMQMMQNASGSKKGKSKSKQQSLSQLQQRLNDRIEELKGSGKKGREMSEELAELAAEQERIRKALSEMQKKMKEQGLENPGSDIPGKMEKTEMDLVNKQLT